MDINVADWMRRGRNQDAFLAAAAAAAASPDPSVPSPEDAASLEPLLPAHNPPLGLPHQHLDVNIRTCVNRKVD